MICVAIQNKSVAECIEAAKSAELAEIRIDLCGFGKEEVKDLFTAQPTKLLATCRPDTMGAEKQMELLKTAIDAGAYMVDIEIEADENFKKEMAEYARSKGCIVIVSYHNYEITPNQTELKNIIKDCFDSGADIAKLATMANSYQDSARLMGLYDTDQNILVLGMGTEGKITRIAATVLGAPFTFAALTKETATAPGQVTAAEMKDAITRLL